MLTHVHEKSQLLGLRSTDLVLDHAIYAKALDVLNISGFHACYILLMVIGKRFGSVGLQDIVGRFGGIWSSRISVEW